jgi:hypothetical protein
MENSARYQHAERSLHDIGSDEPEARGFAPETRKKAASGQGGFVQMANLLRF